MPRDANPCDSCLCSMLPLPPSSAHTMMTPTLYPHCLFTGVSAAAVSPGK